MKKILYILITIILITAVIFLAIYIKSKLQEDALRFKAEYEELNTERQELSIPENNPMKYIDAKEAVEILKNGTGVMYIGYPKCPSCRLAVPPIIEAAKETKTNKVYYLKITAYNNAFEVQNGEITKFKVGASVSLDNEEEATLLQEYIDIMK